MNQDIIVMLERMYDLFTGKWKNPLTAWDYMLEFIVTDYFGALFFELDHQFEWLLEDQKFTKLLLYEYDSKLLRSDNDDHLGEFYFNQVIKKNEGIGNLISMKKARSIVSEQLSETDQSITILDTEAKTGRLLLASHEIVPNGILFGVEGDLRLYRIAYANLIIHDLKGYLLHANTSTHELNISTPEGKHNWQYANKWSSHLDQPRPKNSHQNGQTELKTVQRNATFKDEKINIHT